MHQEETRTRRLVLRPLKASDYVAWRDSSLNRLPAQNRWDAKPRQPSECTREIFRAILARHRVDARADTAYWYAVFAKRSGELVGSIDFYIFARFPQEFANFGYQIFNRHWGQGYGQEAAAAGLRIGFKELRLNRLEAAVNFDNRKSIRLVKAIGMRREGIRKRYWYEHGEWVDHLIYAANPEDIGLRPTKPRGP